MEEQNINQLSDKAFVRLIATSIATIFLCLILLSSTTFAWFTEEVSGNGNTIKAADQCQLMVSVVELATNGTDTPKALDAENAIALEMGKTYQVTLSLPKDSASGYCVLSTTGENGETTLYYTDYIARHTDDEPQTKSFTLTVAENTTVVFTTRWGIYSDDRCDVKNGETLQIDVAVTNS